MGPTGSIFDLGNKWHYFCIFVPFFLTAWSLYELRCLKNKSKFTGAGLSALEICSVPLRFVSGFSVSELLFFKSAKEIIWIPK